MRQREADIALQRRIPAIGNFGERWIQARAQFRHKHWQRIGKIFVLAATEPVLRHHHAFSEFRLVLVKVDNRFAILARQQTLERRRSVTVEFVDSRVPIDLIHRASLRERFVVRVPICAFEFA